MNNFAKKNFKLDRRFVVAGGAAWAVGASSASATAAIPTPRQTAGPFYPTQFPDDIDNNLLQMIGTSSVANGQALELRGAVADRAGRVLPNALVEIWQCDTNGAYHHAPGGGRNPDSGFQGYGRIETDEKGKYRFLTLKPYEYRGRTPHIHFKITSNDFSLTTQMYAADEAKRNRRDGIYNNLSAQEKDAVTVAFTASENSFNDQPILLGRFDIVLPV